MADVAAAVGAGAVTIRFSISPDPDRLRRHTIAVTIFAAVR